MRTLANILFCAMPAEGRSWQKIGIGLKLAYSSTKKLQTDREDQV